MWPLYCNGENYAIVLTNRNTMLNTRNAEAWYQALLPAAARNYR